MLCALRRYASKLGLTTVFYKDDLDSTILDWEVDQNFDVPELCLPSCSLSSFFFFIILSSRLQQQ